jgi:hypothetical protein
MTTLRWSVSYIICSIIGLLHQSHWDWRVSIPVHIARTQVTIERAKGLGSGW